MKSSQGLVKYVIGCWTRPESTSVYTKGKMSDRLWSSRSPKRQILRPTLSTNKVQRILQWERQKRCYGRKRQGPMHMTENYCRNEFLMKFLRGKRRQKRVKLDFFFIKIALFGHILEKIAHSLFCAWSFLLIHSQFTPSEGPKGSVTWILKKPNHGSWTIESYHVEWPSSMVQFHGPWCQPDTNRQDDSFVNCVADVLQHTTHWLKSY